MYHKNYKLDYVIYTYSLVRIKQAVYDYKAVYAPPTILPTVVPASLDAKR